LIAASLEFVVRRDWYFHAKPKHRLPVVSGLSASVPSATSADSYFAISVFPKYHSRLTKCILDG